MYKRQVQIGIRTEFDKDNGFTVLDACQVNDRSVEVSAPMIQPLEKLPIDCALPGTGWVIFCHGVAARLTKEKKETLDKGLSKTKESVFGKIARAVAGKSKVDDEVLDNLEAVSYTHLDVYKRQA